MFCCSFETESLTNVCEISHDCNRLCREESFPNYFLTEFLGLAVNFFIVHRSSGAAVWRCRFMLFQFPYFFTVFKDAWFDMDGWGPFYFDTRLLPENQCLCVSPTLCSCSPSSKKMRSRDSHSVLLRFWTAIEDDFMLFLKGSLKCLYFNEDCFRDKIVKNFLLFFLSTQRCGWKCHRFDKMVFIESGAFTNTIGFKMC